MTFFMGKEQNKSIVRQRKNLMAGVGVLAPRVGDFAGALPSASSVSRAGEQRGVGAAVGRFFKNDVGNERIGRVGCGGGFVQKFTCATRLSDRDRHGPSQTAICGLVDQDGG